MLPKLPGQQAETHPPLQAPPLQAPPPVTCELPGHLCSPHPLLPVSYLANRQRHIDCLLLCDGEMTRSGRVNRLGLEVI